MSLNENPILTPTNRRLRRFQHRCRCHSRFFADQELPGIQMVSNLGSLNSLPFDTLQDGCLH